MKTKFTDTLYGCAYECYQSLTRYS
ncbi:protein of unknown function [Candidatus Promineifilum breve]|uniref:Transposase n=1 Tax=Candidatus Promineifilum breve TaxID=1806508 RepID=A0A160T8E9_9CHLR|nr:protein of unknown function [Candidatus Promineifilum breve]